MFKVSLISLCFLSAGNTLETMTTSKPMEVSTSTMSLNSEVTTSFQTTLKVQGSLETQTVLNTKTTSNSQTSLNPTMSPNSKTNPNSKTTSKPKTTLKTSVTSKIPTTMKTTNVKSGGTILNPKDNIHSLLCNIFAVLCAMKLKWTWTVCIPISVLYHLHCRKIKFISTSF